MARADSVAILSPPDEPGIALRFLPRLRHTGRHALRVPESESPIAGAMVFDSLGHALFSNGALRDLLACEPEAKKLTTALEHRMLAFCDVAREVAGDDGTIPARCCSSAVGTSTADYRFLPIVVGSDASPGAPFFAVVVERIATRETRSRKRRTSAQLTPREVQVANLLCLGRKNSEIARIIHVSLSTTRRHVEHIFAKLGVHRRAEVLVRLLSERWLKIYTAITLTLAAG
jgi:DNA-binding CsgD family transcriptional regulator